MDARYRTTLAAYPELNGIEQIPACTRHASPLLGLAPDGGYPAAVLPRTPVVSYTTFSPLPLARRSIFCGPFPASCPAPDVIRHLALRSADFPRPGHAVPRSSDQPDLLIITDFLNLCEKSFVFRRQEQAPVFDLYIVIIKKRKMILTG